MSDNRNPPPGRNPHPEPEGSEPTRAASWWTEPSPAQPEYLTPDDTAPLPPADPGRHRGPEPQVGPAPGGGSGQGSPSQSSRPVAGPQYGGPGQDGPSRSGTQPGGAQSGGAGQYNPGQYSSSQYSPGQYSPGEYSSGPYGPGQYGGGQYSSGQSGPGQYSSGQYSSGQSGPWSSTPGAQQPAGPSSSSGQGTPPSPYQGQPAYQSQGPAHGSGPGQGPAQGQGSGQGGGPPNWQYPPIPIPQPPGPGPRRGGRISKGLLVMLVALAVLVVGSGVTLALRGGDDAPTTPMAVDTPTPSPTPSMSPTPTPTVKPKPKPKPKPAVKPKPRPRAQTPFELTARNKIYRAGPVQKSGCAEPSYRPTTYAATRAYYNRMLPCLNRSWWTLLKKVGLKYRPPKVVVYAGVIKTPCGTERGTRGYYCGGNETIYMPWQVDAKNYKINPTYTRAWMLNTFAHEYGHHIQQLTGIFGASFARQATMKSVNSRLLESRRRELQASCFGSAYLGRNAAKIPMTGQLLAAWKYAVANAGDEFSKPKIRDHGAKKNHNFWSLRGFASPDPGKCNTWTAGGGVLS